jgi:hypothetical protein
MSENEELGVLEAAQEDQEKRGATTDRRRSRGRRSADLEYPCETCSIHQEAMRRLDERCRARRESHEQKWGDQEKINVSVAINLEKVTNKVDTVSNKMNVLLGAAFVLWPIVQLVIQLYVRAPAGK